MMRGVGGGAQLVMKRALHSLVARSVVNYLKVSGNEEFRLSVLMHKLSEAHVEDKFSGVNAQLRGITEALRKMQARNLLASVDHAGAGVIDFEEFCALSCNRAIPAEALKKEFDSLDASGAGLLDIVSFAGSLVCFSTASLSVAMPSCASLLLLASGGGGPDAPGPIHPSRASGHSSGAPVGIALVLEPRLALQARISCPLKPSLLCCR